MPVHSRAPLSRRRFVAVALGLGGVLVAGACSPSGSAPEEDPLERLARSAARDARELAAADAAHGSDADRLRRVGEVRRIHAEHLTAEIDRLRTDATAAVDELIGTGTEPTRDATDSNDGSAVCPPIDEVRARMRRDAAEAADVAAGSEGYRAELVAAVSAACTAADEVVLA